MEERSTDPGVVSDLERLAMRGEEMPDGLSLADQEFFQGLAYIYARYRMKVIDRATGSREKGKLRHAYEQRKNLEEFQKKLADKRSKTLRETESAITRYRKERTLEAADMLADIIDGATLKAAKGDAKAAKVLFDLLGEQGAAGAGGMQDMDDDPITASLKEEMGNGLL